MFQILILKGYKYFSIKKSLKYQITATVSNIIYVYKIKCSRVILRHSVHVLHQISILKVGKFNKFVNT
jgi:hypothetical protein